MNPTLGNQVPVRNLRCAALVPVHLGLGEEFVGEVLGAGFGEKVMRLSGRLLERHAQRGSSCDLRLIIPAPRRGVITLCRRSV